MEESRVIHEITPLMGKDSLYIADRRKKEFTYPIHNHEVFELNFVEHAPGVRRIVGDSNEIIGEYDMGTDNESRPWSMSGSRTPVRVTISVR